MAIFKTTIYTIVLTASMVLVGCTSNSGSTQDQTIATQELQTFAQCLTQKGVVFYGTQRCQYCKQQKESFGDAMTFVPYVDCDQNKLACTTAGVTSYPTWIINGAINKGVQSLESLSQQTGCPLPSGS